METRTIIILAVVAALVIWNLVVFMIYAIDKRRAEQNKWRISEAALIGNAFLMGGVGAFLGMRILRHKTKHIKFIVLVPLAIVVNLAVVGAAVFLLIR
ncbi:MAG: DUF1294 domain-containing protein [Defluviitaleaceae bacterium]|nr:DUF1294 domain-containing protein [Defluviitaleaceae bacterium]